MGGSYEDIIFIDQNNGWIVGNGNQIVHTSDGGITWHEENISTVTDLNSIVFLNDSIGWVTGKLDFDGVILCTNNGGIDWYVQHSDNYDFYGIDFVNGSLGWAVGEAGIIVHTDDGGENWYQQDSHVNEYLNSVSFADVENGWIVGRHGLVLKTTNGGENWEIHDLGINNGLNSVKFFDAQNGWAVGSDGIILKYYTITNLKNSTNFENSVDAFILNGNYPNPFNSSTQFSYYIPNANLQHVEIAVYDILGKKVKTLLKKNQHPGNYTIHWNGKTNAGTNCPSGVYLCSFQIEKQNVVRKMILIR